jgi:hypothetical protein
VASDVTDGWDDEASTAPEGVSHTGEVLAVAGEPGQDGLNPAQREVLSVLGARPHERPEFDPRLRDDLREELEDRLAPLVDHLPPKDDLWLSKRGLATVHGCEGLFAAEDEEEFAWSPRLAVGTVAHKAIELSVNWRGEPVPGDLVDEGIARLIAEGRGIGDYLGGLREAERADLRSGAVERTTMFLECFPPLEPRWRPVTELRLRADLCGARVVLSGKVDLAVGRADGLRAGKVLVDLKTGGFAPSHREDLRFYALLETLRVGVPPRLVASYYLDGGRPHEEAVDEDVLSVAVERVVRGATAIVELRHLGRGPVLKPGPPCRWCPRRETCEPGIAFLRRRDEDDGLGSSLDGW